MLSYVQWKYKIELNVRYPPSINGYQATFVLKHQQGMYRDFRDIRFSTVEREPINYFIEDISKFKSCRVWLSLPANITKFIMHYGNGAVVSESNASRVFDFYTNCTSLDMWTVETGSASVDDGVLKVNNYSTYSTLTSKTSYPVNSIVEIRAHHDSGNECFIGFRKTSTLQAAAWAGYWENTNDHMYTNSGSAASYVDDTTIRAGETFYIYGVAHLTAGDKFYINYSLRGTATSNLPGNVSLPIQIYSENAKSVFVDWVRVRKYLATEPVITLGKRHIPQSIAYLFNESKYTSSETVAILEINKIHIYYNDIVPVYVKAETYMGDPVEFTSTETVSISAETNITKYEYLSDYPLNSCDVSKSTSDVYMQLSADFEDVCPTEGSTITHIVRDSQYVKHTLFCGKVVTKTPKLSYLGNSVSIEAADISRNLSVQPVPWNYQVMSLDEKHTRFTQWIIELLDTEHTGVIQGNIIDTLKPDKQFIFKPTDSRLDAIKEISDYLGCIAHIKLIEKYDTSTDRINVIPALYVVPVSSVDQQYGGFDLPSPIEFTWPDETIVDEPTTPGEQDVQYNSVLVYGVLSNTNETVVAVACTPEVSTGEKYANTYTVEDNGIYEKGSSAEIEAIKWLLYFNTQKSSVQMKFIDRFDLELYQRIRFGDGFSEELRSLTNSKQLSHVVAYDPRDEENSRHNVNVSGVPTPSWLRIAEIKYHSENVNNYCEIKAVTDYIYSSADSIVQPPYNLYCAPGYYKPTSDDSTSTTQAIVDATVTKSKSTIETATLLSIDAVTKTGVIRTDSGKIMKVVLPWL